MYPSRIASTYVQAPGAVVMIRPHHFRSNEETMTDNAFQKATPDGVSGGALAEVDAAIDKLRAAGVEVHAFDDHDTDRPDSVFPNNWFSTHHGGHIAVYPMQAPSRQRERRWDVIEYLKRFYRVQDVVDFSGLEYDGLSLEGTGAMVLDHISRVAYTVRSNRADPILLERFCTHFRYEPMVFDATDLDDRPVYHTNVLMAVGTGYAMICLDMITDPERRAEIATRLVENGRHLVELSQAQIKDFAGNALELMGKDGPILALSERAFSSLTDHQIETISEHAKILPLNVPIIERAGGSVRCMLAGVHLAKRPTEAGDVQ